MKFEMRIYDLARGLVPDNLKDEKDRKNYQANVTRQILDLLKQFGQSNKTASSALDDYTLKQILTKLNQQMPSNISSPASSSPKTKAIRATAPDQASPSESQKKHRTLRRITRLPSDEAKADSEAEEQSQQPEAEELHDIEEESGEEILELDQAVALPEETHSEESDSQFKVQEEDKKPLNAQHEHKNQEESSARHSTQPAPTFTFRREGGSIMTTPKTEPRARVASSPTPTTTDRQQPYRVAKPVNAPFSAARRKGAPAVRKPVPGQKPPFSSGRHGGGAPSKQKPEIKARPSELILTHQVTVKELAQLLEVQETEIIRNLFLKGIMRTVNQMLDMPTIVKVGEELGCLILTDDDKPVTSTALTEKLKDLVSEHGGDDYKGEVVIRPPVVTIMGHVDHGKTTLLDAIRKSKKQITSTESGGITQHIGAYQIEVKDYDDNLRKVTFLDTPGHEAFTALRARGAQVTDIAILVVSADDGVMPQTIEAISHAKAAGVPIIVAVNKIDKPEAYPDRVLGQLTEHGLVVEDFGGTVICSKISAKQRINLDDLLSKITLAADAELGDKLLARPDTYAVGAVIEAALSPNRGTVATLLVQSGTLKKGDAIAAGGSYGRVRALFDDEGREIENAPPSTPVQVLGLDSLPQAGDTFRIFPNAQEARQSAEKTRQRQAQQRRSRGLETFSSEVREGQAKELPIVIKADVQGSAEAIASELMKLSTPETSVRIVHCAAGAVTESDINLAATTNAIVVNFHTSVDGATSKLATDNDVQIYTCNIIYEITDTVQKAIHGLLEPEKVEVRYGTVEIRQVFPVGKNKVAGCQVTDGKLIANGYVKIFRGKKEIASVSIQSLRRFKDDVKEVLQGFECGVSFDGFNDFEPGDTFECWRTEFQERKM
ncbi:MAG: translation initiation factor IF-2 [Candidatus Caenarcaniphilales bacterium]|nr:translation initiation factor IF-2 [Candidatus Caenarcaniphilales bacterium]